MIAMGPAHCIVCAAPVWWNGQFWRDRYRRHVCPVDRPWCGFHMPKADELCARKPGHRNEHRSRYAMDNALRKRTGHGLREVLAGV